MITCNHNKKIAANEFHASVSCFSGSRNSTSAHGRTRSSRRRHRKRRIGPQPCEAFPSNTPSCYLFVCWQSDVILLSLLAGTQRLSYTIHLHLPPHQQRLSTVHGARYTTVSTLTTHFRKLPHDRVYLSPSRLLNATLLAKCNTENHRPTYCQGRLNTSLKWNNNVVHCPLTSRTPR